MAPVQLDLAWQQALTILEKQVSTPALETWFYEARPVTMQGNTLVLAVANEFARDYIQSRYYPLIQEALQQVLGRKIIKIQVICFPLSSSNQRQEPELEDPSLPPQP